VEVEEEVPWSISRPRAWEEALQVLRRKILSEELAPGTRLVETTYARRLGVSQSTLREALVRLAHEGLVMSIPRRGTYVAAVPTDTVNYLYELRDRVEPLAMRLAMKSLHKEDIEYLEHQVSRMYGRTANERIDADMAFHRRLYELTQFPPLQGLWPQIEVLTRRILSMSHRIGSTEATNHNHGAIMQALVAADQAELDRAIRDHMHQIAVVFEGGVRSTGRANTATADGAHNPAASGNDLSRRQTVSRKEGPSG
jgi:DNA-binding GntR family transcriptional regulator